MTKRAVFIQTVRRGSWMRSVQCCTKWPVLVTVCVCLWGDQSSVVRGVREGRGGKVGREFSFLTAWWMKLSFSLNYRQLCECSWVAQPQPGIKPSQIFLEKPENVRLTPSNQTELERWRGEEKNSRFLKKLLETVKVLQRNISFFFCLFF